jgi:hypothetical protein
MKSHEDIEKLLSDLGNQWPEDGSIVNRVMQTIDSAPASPILHKQRRILTRSLIGMSTCLGLVIIFGIVSFLSLTTSITLAQVQEAIAKQGWLHIKYDNGRENWNTLDGEKEIHRQEDGYIAFFDHPKDLDLRYRPGDKYITQLLRENPGKWKPMPFVGIVGFSMDMPEGEATAKQKESPRYSERHSDIINGRQLVRFDQCERDALGQYLLIKQVWVDPQTRLPVRVKSLVKAEQNNRQELKYTIGEYDFPAHGPESIYDIGLSRDLPIVQGNPQKSKDVSKAIDLAVQARDRFPACYQLIIWPNDNSEIDVIYRDGAPVYKQGHLDWSGVRVRQDHYFNLEEKYPQYHFSMPATAEQVLAWTRTQTPVQIYMSDGKRYFDKYGPFPTSFYNESNNPRTRLSVKMQYGEPLGPNTPIQDHWPLTNLSGGSFVFLDEGEKTMPDTIAIRNEYGNTRHDYYLDTARDYICINWVWWEKRSDKWAKDREEMLLDLKQLPKGQWYAIKKHLKTYGSPLRKTVGYEKTWNLDVKILQENEFPADTFNGDKMLEDAKREGAVIETY